MPYNIMRSDGTPLVTIPDGAINTTTTSLALIGRNAFNFGQAIDQNFVYLLQNFASTTAPNSPLVGQLWYDQSIRRLRVYDNARWNTINPPFDGSTGIASVRVGPFRNNVLVTLAEGKIISVTCYAPITAANLPDIVVISDSRYSFKPLFPNGLQPGINLAIDGETNLKFIGQATSANVLATARTISLTGALSGSALFDGSSNINIEASFSNLYIGNTNVTVAGTYSKVVVDNTGRVIGGGNITNADVIQALGYVPYSGANVNVAAQGNSIVARDANGNFAANIMVGTATTAYALRNPIMLAINGDVIGAVSFDGSSNVTIQSQLAPVSNLIAGTYSTVRVDNKGRVVSGSRTADTPVGAIILWNNTTVIPEGFARANGQTVSTPDGDTVTTPNLANITVGGTNFYIMKVY